MTVTSTSAPQPYTRLHAEFALTPLATSLSEVFTLDPTLLQQLAAELSSGQIALQQTTAQFAAYVGPSCDKLALIKHMAESGNAAAQRELHDILEYHRASRVELLLPFLLQLPSKWRVLLGTLREEVCSLAFKFDNGSVVDLVHLSDSMRYEYALRGFYLTFRQTIEIAEWMRANSELLVLHSQTDHRDTHADLAGKSAGARTGLLIALFDYLPEDLRSLLAKKVRPEVTYVGFVTDPSGEVCMEVRYA